MPQPQTKAQVSKDTIHPVLPDHPTVACRETYRSLAGDITASVGISRTRGNFSPPLTKCNPGKNVIINMAMSLTKILHGFTINILGRTSVSKTNSKDQFFNTLQIRHSSDCACMNQSVKQLTFSVKIPIPNLNQGLICNEDLGGVSMGSSSISKRIIAT